MKMHEQPATKYALDHRAPLVKPDYGFVEVIDGVVRVHTPTGEDVVHRRWHANGVLESERFVVHYKTVGLIQEWHGNDALAKEIPHERGGEHGVV